MPEITVREIAAPDLDAIAEIEVASFANPLTLDDLAAMNDRPAFHGFGLTTQGRLVSYALFLNAGRVADLVSTGTATGARRQGFASWLLAESLHRLGARGVEEIMLEVAVDNAAALALYAGLGFHEVGRRRAYYRRARGRVDALVLRCQTAPQGTA